MVNIRADVVVGVQYGDEGKGKVTHHLASKGDYTHVIRYGGGCNAGHTIFHNGKKFVTHHIPAGIFFGIKSIIGSGCVINPEQFFKELCELREAGLPVDDKLFIAGNCHVITDEHLVEDRKDTSIGTTKRGNGPAYRDKYSRAGIQASSLSILKPYITDLYEDFFQSGEEVNILCEGAQGFGLDIDWGDYPYVTSSHCNVGGAILNGIPPKSIDRVWGVAKVYETYVGAKQYQPANKEVFDRICSAGGEFGSTTGRRRQVNWMDINLLLKAVNLNGVTDLVINKVDILREVGEWGLINGRVTEFDSEGEFKTYVEKVIPSDVKVYWSDNPERI